MEFCCWVPSCFSNLLLVIHSSANLKIHAYEISMLIAPIFCYAGVSIINWNFECCSGMPICEAFAQIEQQPNLYDVVHVKYFDEVCNE